MDDIVFNKQIEDLANQARKHFAGSRIYGKSVDLNNLEHVLAALYCISIMPPRSFVDLPFQPRMEYKTK